MLTLSLLRHAKSSWSGTPLEDFERPLSRRGEKAAPRMGAFMARRGLAPDLILCSPAVRARQTLELVLPRLKRKPEVVYDEALYLASPGAMLKRIRKVGGEVSHAMLVGHNPGLEELVLELAGSAAVEDDIAALGDKMPTAALAVLLFDGDLWSRVKRGTGRLDLFMTPKRLKGADCE